MTISNLALIAGILAGILVGLVIVLAIWAAQRILDGIHGLERRNDEEDR